MRTEEKLYTVYRLKNVVTQKNYIGMTSQKPKHRWCREYTGKMKEAIKEFPLDLCWKKSIEFQTPNKEQALELEAELMKWYDSVENGYNTSDYSSHSCKHSEKTKNRMSASLTGNHNRPQTPVIQFSKTGEFIDEYPSIKEAERMTGCSQGHICACCKGKLKSTGGYIWKYK